MTRRAASSGFHSNGKVLLVAGALAGARSLNEVAVEAFGDDGPAVLHLTGERDFELVRSRVSRDDYVVLPSTDHFGAALGAADLALARAGGSVWELAAAGLPAVLVPYPHATADHQTRNAEHFERAGGAVVVPDSELERAPRRRALAARGRSGARRHARGDARRRTAGRRRGDRGGAGAACKSRSPVGASGSSGSAVRGCRATRSSRTRGGRRSAAGTAPRRRTSRTFERPASRCRSRPSRSCRTGGRPSSRPPSTFPARAAPSCSRSSSRSSVRSSSPARTARRRRRR